MKRYMDLFIRAKDAASFKEMVKTAKNLGYELIGFEENELKDEFIKICNELNIKYIIRTQVYAKKIEEKIYYLDFINKKQCLSLIKKYRIHILKVDLDKINDIDKELINFISQRKVHLEFLYTHFLKINFEEYSNILNRFRNILDYCIRKNLNPIISSGADEKKYIRAPKDVIGFIKCLKIKNNNLENMITVDQLEDLFYEIY